MKLINNLLNFLVVKIYKNIPYKIQNFLSRVEFQFRSKSFSKKGGGAFLKNCKVTHDIDKKTHKKSKQIDLYIINSSFFLVVCFFTSDVFGSANGSVYLFNTSEINKDIHC